LDSKTRVGVLLRYSFPLQCLCL